MGVVHAGSRNPNWRGGRSVASNGYVLIRVGKDHHLADARGYAYEHRLVAENMLGRRLREGEEVHHRDDTVAGRSNNDPSNLEVKESHAEHALAHRVPGSLLRLPGEPNPMVTCGCGCGGRFSKYDTTGRPRVYVSGHNPHDTSRREAVLLVMADGPLGIDDLVGILGASRSAVRQAVSKWARAGLVVRVSHGRYGLPGTAVESPRIARSILCACGCGATLSDIDQYGRDRRFISGHNARKVANG